MERIVKRGNARKRTYERIIAIAVLVLATTCLNASTVAAGIAFADSGGCSAPTADYGKDATTVSISTAGNYRIWSHLQAPNASAASYMLQVDSSSCFSVGGGSAIAPDTWTWVGYTNGDPTKLTLANLAAGAHSLTLIGTAAGGRVDDILLTTDSSCIPVSDGSNCNTGASSVAVATPGASTGPRAETAGSGGGTQPGCSSAKNKNSAACKSKDIVWPVVMVLGLAAVAAGGGGWYLWRTRRSRS